MNSKQIALFLELSQTLNYRKTAANMFISQPALTHQIHALESEIGVQLFARGSKGVSLTPAGELFRRDIARIVQRTEDSIIAARNCSLNGYSETLHIGMNVMRTFDGNAELVRRFREQHPEILLDLVNHPSGTDRLNSFLRNEIDCVFLPMDQLSDNEGVCKAHLFDSKIYCVLPKAHPLAQRERILPEDLSAETMIIYNGNGLDALHRAQNSITRPTTADGTLCRDTESALLWVLVLNAVALMPGFCYRENAQFAWIPFATEENIPCGLAWHHADVRTSMLDFVRTA